MWKKGTEIVYVPNLIFGLRSRGVSGSKSVPCLASICRLMQIPFDYAHKPNLGKDFYIESCPCSITSLMKILLATFLVSVQLQ